jgi:hypothetical protein
VSVPLVQGLAVNGNGIAEFVKPVRCRPDVARKRHLHD